MGSFEKSFAVSFCNLVVGWQPNSLNIIDSEDMLLTSGLVGISVLTAVSSCNRVVDWQPNSLTEYILLTSGLIGISMRGFTLNVI